ncbi:MAG: hypothetical protein KY461_15315 [Actinobacteria bacterium]|nr:hypothetical protein [Actinomycetota bacterium]
MRLEDVAAEDDTSVLWQALVAAKADHHLKLIRAIEQRMRELAVERRFAHLSDEELRQRIDAMRGNREPTGMLGHSPGLGGGGGDSSEHISAFNEAHRRDQHAGVEVTLRALEDERDRRRADRA